MSKSADLETITCFKNTLLYKNSTVIGGWHARSLWVPPTFFPASHPTPKKKKWSVFGPAATVCCARTNQDVIDYAVTPLSYL